jgi:hypothetical protein
MTAHHPPRLLGLSARKRTTCQNMDGGGRPKAIVNGGMVGKPYNLTLSVHQKQKPGTFREGWRRRVLRDIL